MPLMCPICGNPHAGYSCTYCVKENDMTTREVFVIENGNYDDEADECKDVFIELDDDRLNVDPPLTGCDATDLLKLASWVSGMNENKEE